MKLDVEGLHEIRRQLGVSPRPQDAPVTPFSVVADRFPRERPPFPAFAEPEAHAMVGWTAPTLIYDKMRTIQYGAAQLDRSIRAHVGRDVLRDAWEDWYLRWREFFRRYQDGTAQAELQKLGALTYTDDLDRQVDQFKRELDGWYAGYGGERGPGGGPLPPVPATDAASVARAPKEGSSSVLPWWAWMLGGVAVIGLGYYVYRRVFRRASSGDLQRSALPVSRDAELPSRRIVVREVGPDEGSRMLSDMLGTEQGAEQIVRYRPYEHPHIVSVRPLQAELPASALIQKTEVDELVAWGAPDPRFEQTKPHYVSLDGGGGRDDCGGGYGGRRSSWYDRDDDW